MSLKPYKNNNLSSIYWLNEMPINWSRTKLKYLSAIRTGYAFSSDDFQEDGVPVIRIGDISTEGKVDFSAAKYLPEAYSTIYKRVEINYGDIVMAMTGATIGKAGKYEYAFPALLNQRVCSFIPQINTDHSFLWYILNSDFYLDYINLKAIGGAQPNISDSELLEFTLICPVHHDQSKIASFLDSETAKLDTLISKQETLIKLLQEKRQALISHAVTKGLNPDVSMKDSGVEWLGKVPAHWEIKRVKHISSINDEVLTDSFDPNEEIEYVDIGSVSLENGVEKTELMKFSEAPSRARRKVRDGDIIVSTVRTYLKAIAWITNPQANLICSTGFAVIRPGDNYLPSFANFSIQSCYFIDEVISRSVGVSYPAINSSDIGFIKLPVPSVEEQNAISTYLTEETNKIDSLIIKARQSIELAKEHRSALISAAVTGKIDVREAARLN